MANFLLTSLGQGKLCMTGDGDLFVDIGLVLDRSEINLSFLVSLLLRLSKHLLPNPSNC